MGFVTWSLNLRPIFSSGRSLNEIILLPGFPPGMWGGPDRQLLCFWSTLHKFPSLCCPKSCWSIDVSNAPVFLVSEWDEAITSNIYGSDSGSSLRNGLLKTVPKIPPSDALLLWTSSCLSCYGSDGVIIVEATLMFYYSAAQQNPPNNKAQWNKYVFENYPFNSWYMIYNHFL